MSADFRSRSGPRAVEWLEDWARRADEDEQVCLHCGEQRHEHYIGTIRGCRQGRTHFTPARGETR